jgi:GTPase SAR1 family protein
MYRGLMLLYIREAQLVVLVFDLTTSSSFAAIDGWVASVKEKAVRKVSYLLVGNKVDLEEKREISIQQAQEKQQAIGAFEYVETSALNGSGIDTFCDNVISECKKSLKNEQYPFAPDPGDQ